MAKATVEGGTDVSTDRAKEVAATLGFMGKDIEEWLSGLDEDTRITFFEMMSLPEESLQLEKDMARATALRDKEGPRGRHTRNNIFRAANPLEHLASGIDKYQGRQDVASAKEDQERIRALRGEEWPAMMAAQFQGAPTTEGTAAMENANVAPAGPQPVPLDTGTATATPLPAQPALPTPVPIQDPAMAQQRSQAAALSGELPTAASIPSGAPVTPKDRERQRLEAELRMLDAMPDTGVAP